MNAGTSPSATYLGISATILLAGGFFVLTLGCVPPPTRPKATTTQSTPIDELTLAFESLRSISHPSAVERVYGQITNAHVTKARGFLNSWLGRQDIEALPWELDPMFKGTPRTIREHPQFSTFGRLDFTDNDTRYLQHCLWLNDIAHRCSQQPAAPQLAAWLREMDAAGKVDEAAQLRQAERLFDWTVRNIQLMPLLENPEGPEATVKPATTDADPTKGIGDISKPRVIQPGPGYLQLPHETLLRGRGDAWERARIFLQLCQQSGITGCMLGLVKEGESTPQPWAAAVLLGEDLYLFDPQLGLAIPGPKRTGIATLNQFVADEKVREQLKPTGGPEYPVTTKDAAAIAALIEVQPEALTRRMLLLEAPLNAARQQSRTERVADEPVADELLDIVLTARPHALEKKLRGMKHIGTLSLWRIAFEAELFAQQGQEQLEAARGNPNQLPPYLLYRILEEEVLQHRFNLFQGESGIDRSLTGDQQQRSRAPREVTLMQGRDYLLRGRLETVDTRLGARAVFLSTRTPDSFLDMLEFSPKNRREYLKDDPYLPLDPEKREEEIERRSKGLVAMRRRAKDVGTYWLGLTYFEDGDYANAIDWLQQILNKSEPSEWQPGARYLLARCYEAQGKSDQAREVYAADDSLQAAGNKLRAEWLVVEKPPVKTEEPPAKEEPATTTEKQPAEAPPAKPEAPPKKETPPKKTELGKKK